MSTTTPVTSSQEQDNGHVLFRSLIYVQNLPTNACQQDVIRSFIHDTLHLKSLLISHPKISKNEFKETGFILMDGDDSAAELIKIGISVSGFRDDQNGRSVPEMYPLELSRAFLKPARDSDISNKLTFQNRSGVELVMDVRDLFKYASDRVNEVLRPFGAIDVFATYDSVFGKKYVEGPSVRVTFKHSYYAMLVKALCTKSVCTVRNNGKPKYTQSPVVCFYTPVSVADESSLFDD